MDSHVVTRNAIQAFLPPPRNDESLFLYLFEAERILENHISRLIEDARDELITELHTFCELFF